MFNVSDILEEYTEASTDQNKIAAFVNEYGSLLDSQPTLDQIISKEFVAQLTLWRDMKQTAGMIVEIQEEEAIIAKLIPEPRQVIAAIPAEKLIYA